MACLLKLAMLSKLVASPLNTDVPASTPAFDLVVSLLRARFDASGVLLDLPLKPKFLEAIDLAGRHGIAAALAGGLKNLVSAGKAWDDLVPFLDAIEAWNVKQNAQLRKSALSLARCLEEAGIRCVNLKGAAFLFDKQADAAWRVVGDLDVLVPIESVEAAADALLAKGYRLATDSNFSTVARNGVGSPTTAAAYNPTYHHHYAPLYDETNNVLVELHARLMKNRSDELLQAHEVFAKAIPVTIEEQALLIPSPEHRMIHCIAHAQISNWGYALRQISLKEVVDAAELASQYDIDWADVRRHFAAVGAISKLVGFACATTTLTGISIDLDAADIRAGERWALKAIAALQRPPAVWKTSLRVLAQYTRVIARNPIRLAIVWKTLKDPQGWREKIRTNRRRLGRADHEP